MDREKIKIVDESGDRNYFTMVPNYILNHSSAKAQALYMQLKRLAGEKGVAFPSRDFLMKKLDISKPTLLKELGYLVDKKWIETIGDVVVKTKGGNQKVKGYKIVDIWKLNVDYYESNKGVKSNTYPEAEGVKNSIEGGKESTLKGVKNSTPNKNQLIRTIKEERESNNRIIAGGLVLPNDNQMSTNTIFSLNDEIKKLEDSNRRDMNIIALFIEKKKPIIENKEQMGVLIKRHLRAASQLKDFSDEQIIKATKEAEDKYKDMWTLETLIKLLTK